MTSTPKYCKCSTEIVNRSFREIFSIVSEVNHDSKEIIFRGLQFQLNFQLSLFSPGITMKKQDHPMNIKYYITSESAFLFRDRDRPVTVSSPSRHYPVTVPSLGVLNRPTSLSVLRRPQPSITVLNRP